MPLCDILDNEGFCQDTVVRRWSSILVFALLFAISSCSSSDNSSRSLARLDNDSLGLPARNDANFQVVDRLGFCLGYDEKHEQSSWVCYKLTRTEVTNNKVKRTDNFRPDPEITTKSAELVDYKGSGYDRGHLAPAGDMAWSAVTMSESFFLSNISPQDPSFNRGIWRSLEELVRSWAMQNEEVFVITGPLLANGLKTIGPNSVSVPDFYYKVILDYYGSEKKGIAFLLPNKSADASLLMFVKSINDIELVTGFDFFHKLPDSEEEQLESTADLELWGLTPPVDSTVLRESSQSQQSVEADQKNEDRQPKAAYVYWLTSSSDVRHNATCRWYKKSKGHLCPKTEGRACKLCGG